jgi:hypothetical protein
LKHSFEVYGELGGVDSGVGVSIMSSSVSQRSRKGNECEREIDNDHSASGRTLLGRTYGQGHAHSACCSDGLK